MMSCSRASATKAARYRSLPCAEVELLAQNRVDGNAIEKATRWLLLPFGDRCSFTSPCLLGSTALVGLTAEQWQELLPEEFDFEAERSVYARNSCGSRQFNGVCWSQELWDEDSDFRLASSPDCSLADSERSVSETAGLYEMGCIWVNSLNDLICLGDGQRLGASGRRD